MEEGEERWVGLDAGYWAGDHSEREKKTADQCFFASLAIFESNRRKRIIKNIPVQFDESG